MSRTFYAKGQTGQQLLLGAYSAMNRQIGRGKIKMYNRHEMLDVVVVDGKARGIIARNLVTVAAQWISNYLVSLTFPMMNDNSSRLWLVQTKVILKNNKS